MSTTRLAAPGKSRKCPHCRCEILESASVCPACRHHLKFGSAAEQASFSALHVEGTIDHPTNAATWEYSVVVVIRNQKGEEIARQVVGIGALQGGDKRTFDLSVEVFTPKIKSAAPPAALAPVQQTSAVSPSRSVAATVTKSAAATVTKNPAPTKNPAVSPARLPGTAPLPGLPGKRTKTPSGH